MCGWGHGMPVFLPLPMAGLCNYSLQVPSTLFSTFWDTHLSQLEALANLLSENQIIETNGMKMLVHMRTHE
jgi:hypothetical protein